MANDSFASKLVSLILWVSGTLESQMSVDESILNDGHSCWTDNLCKYEFNRRSGIHTRMKRNGYVWSAICSASPKRQRTESRHWRCGLIAGGVGSNRRTGGRGFRNSLLTLASYTEKSSRSRRGEEEENRNAEWVTDVPSGILRRMCSRVATFCTRFCSIK